MGSAEAKGGAFLGFPATHLKGLTSETHTSYCTFSWRRHDASAGPHYATTFLTWKASARREGALHSTPRSLSNDQKVSSSNHARWLGTGTPQTIPLSCRGIRSSERGT